MNKTQTSEIKKYLETHKRGITPFEAYDKFGVTRLGSIVYELRHRHNMDIVSESKAIKNRYGKTSIVANYRIA